MSTLLMVDDGRSFTGDCTTGVKLLGKNRGLVKDTGNQSELYCTAAIFKSPGCYQFAISETRTYILRLHFYAFSSASGNLLLSNFSGEASLGSLVIKEFLLTVSRGEFNVFFVLSSSLMEAFVNAIELFNANTTIGTPVAVSSGLRTNLKSTAPSLLSGLPLEGYSFPRRVIALVLAAPFYLVLLVKPDDLGSVNISIGSKKGTRITQNGFLNGLEIIDAISTFVVEPHIRSNVNRKEIAPLIDDGFVLIIWCVVDF